MRYRGEQLECEPESLRPGASVLEQLEAAGLEIPSSCRLGECHTCLLRLRKGRLLRAHGHLSEQERALGYFLSCVDEISENAEMIRIDDVEPGTRGTIHALKTGRLELRIPSASGYLAYPGQWAWIDSEAEAAHKRVAIARSDASRLELIPIDSLDSLPLESEVWLSEPRGLAFLTRVDPQQPVVIVACRDHIELAEALASSCLGTTRHTLICSSEPAPRHHSEDPHLEYRGDLSEAALATAVTQNRSAILFLLGPEPQVRPLKTLAFTSGIPLDRIHWACLPPACSPPAK